VNSTLLVLGGSAFVGRVIATVARDCGKHQADADETAAFKESLI
jgi:hypothetical protein